ncbi:MAG: ribonuclease Y [Candidatus Bipolaricaulia bacterium]
MLEYLTIPLSVILLVLGYWAGRIHYQRRLDTAQRRVQEIIAEAQREAENLKKEIVLTAKEEIQNRREALEQRVKEREQELSRLETQLLEKQDRLGKKSNYLERIEDSLREDETMIEAVIRQGKALLEQERHYLAEISKLSTEGARDLLLKQMERESQRYFANQIRKIKDRAEEQAEREANRIIASAIERYASDYVEENLVCSVPLPSDDYKGRIIGREGRNIRTFEALTGVDVIVDDTPETVVLSSFHPIRREIARLAMQKLIKDGRIHPAHIEEKVGRARQEITDRIKETGQKALFEAGIDGMPSQLVELIGEMRFRTSYGQNILRHSLEVSFIAGMLASELGLNPQPGKRAGLLHDIGKLVSHEVDGPHAIIGADLAERCGESEEVVHAIRAHHNDIEPETILDFITKAADTLSAARPGARQETFESYIQRLKDLEAVANSFPEVEETYAVQAGREIRVMVKPHETGDDTTAKLAYDIARKIEEEIEYPGEIKVNVIKKLQFTDKAR